MERMCITMIIVCFDPGNHTGWVAQDTETGKMEAGTLLEETMMEGLIDVFNKLQPEIVVFETFNLYPGMAKSLSWNSFYPVEVIGQIKLLCKMNGITKIVGQAPSIKKYAGQPTRAEVADLRERCKHSNSALWGIFTEHTKDAWLHLLYFRRFKKI